MHTDKFFLWVRIPGKICILGIVVLLFIIHEHNAILGNGRKAVYHVDRVRVLSLPCQKYKIKTRHLLNFVRRSFSLVGLVMNYVAPNPGG